MCGTFVNNELEVMKTHFELESYLTVALGCSVSLMIWLLLSLPFAWPLELLWNWLMPSLFGFAKITFWKAWGLEILFALLLGNKVSYSTKRTISALTNR